MSLPPSHSSDNTTRSLLNDKNNTDRSHTASPVEKDPLVISLSAAASWEGVEDSFWEQEPASTPVVAVSLKETANDETSLAEVELASAEVSESASSPEPKADLENAFEESIRVEISSAVALSAESSDVVDSWRLLTLLASNKGVDVWTAQPVNAPAHDRTRYVLKQARRDSVVARNLVRQEVAVLSSLTSRSIVPLLDFKVTNESPYLVVPQLPAPVTSTHRSKCVARHQLARVLSVARQTARALCELHEQGWIHGDLAARHVSIDEALHVTLFDLSLARAIHGGSQVDRDAWKGCVTGSLETLAPEGFDPAEPVLAERDCYALGVTLVWWLSGNSPWSDVGAAAWQTVHRTQPPDLSRLHRAGYPVELLSLLERMLAKQPLRRPAMEEVERQLLDLEIDFFGIWCQSEAA